MFVCVYSNGGDDDGSPNNTMHITRWHNICRTRITKQKKRFIVFLCAVLRKMLFKTIRTMRLMYKNTANTPRYLRECNKILKYYIWPNEQRTELSIVFRPFHPIFNVHWRHIFFVLYFYRCPSVNQMESKEK